MIKKRNYTNIKEIKTKKIPVRVRFHIKDKKGGHYIFMKATKIVRCNK